MGNVTLPGEPRLVACETADGFELHGLWIDAANSSQAGAASDAAIVLPGVGGNFYASRLCHRIAGHLYARGHSVLLANTRGHDVVALLAGSGGMAWGGAAFEIVAECAADIKAWQGHAVQAGCRAVLLVGHSLGAIKVLYAASRAAEGGHANSRLRAVIAVSPPRLNHRRIAQSAEADVFLQSYHEAVLREQQGRAEEPFFVHWPFRTLMTPRTFLDKYGPASRYDFLRWLPRLTVPALFTYGSREIAEGGAAFAGIDQAIATRRPGTHVTLRVVDGADHFYRGFEPALFDAISGWLDVLPPAGTFANTGEPLH